MFPSSCLMYHFHLVYQPSPLHTFRFFLYVMLKLGSLLIRKPCTHSSVRSLFPSWVFQCIECLSKDTSLLDMSSYVCLRGGGVRMSLFSFCCVLLKGHTLQQFIHYLIIAGCASTQLLFTCRCSSSHYVFICFHG